MPEIFHPKIYLALIEKTINAFGSIDILVNNAGTIRRAPAAEYPQNYWDELIAVNLTSVFRLSQLAGQDMLKRGAQRQDPQPSVPAFFLGRVLSATERLMAQVCGRSN